MVTAALPDLTAQIDRAMVDFGAAAAAFYERILREFNAVLTKLCDLFRRAAEVLLPPLATRLRRVLWTAIARRHADRPPTRGFWLRRCWCLACRERKGLA